MATSRQEDGSMVAYGYGIYAHDDAFKAPIFRGTDLTMLDLVIPN